MIEFFILKELIVQIEIKLEDTPAVIGFATDRVTIFYCAGHPQGATDDINLATRFTGRVAREAAMTTILNKYPKCDRTGLMFTYIP